MMIVCFNVVNGQARTATDDLLKNTGALSTTRGRRDVAREEKAG